jgi:hypothetical protein
METAEKHKLLYALLARYLREYFWIFKQAASLLRHSNLLRATSAAITLNKA